jgi:hypothetical protein
MELEEHGTARPDAKGRITLGSLAKGVSSFRIYVDDQERIVLEPYAEIPAREKWLHENPKALASLRKGIKQAEEGKTRPLGSFARFADNEDD